MKLKINISKRLLALPVYLVCFLILSQANLYAQDSTAAASTEKTVSDQPEQKTKPVYKPVKNSFNSIWIIDNQTALVPIKGTFEMDIQHRFGTVQKGYDDFWGFFAPSNIRLGVTYAPINRLNLGLGVTKSNMLWDASAKYAIAVQRDKIPVSITYYGNVSYSTLKDADKSIFKYTTQRLLFYNEIIIARKINDKLSIQVGADVSHQNAVNGYYTKNDSTGKAIFRNMKYDHFAVSFSGRYKLTKVTSLMVNYDQPITKHATNNPNPNLSFGFEFNSSGHSFQLFAGNYSLLNPARNNLYNTNNPFGYTKEDGTKVPGGAFLIGFNVTRLWNW